MSAEQPRRFVLRRSTDVTGISGTGDVAWGVRFPDGVCVLRWNTDHSSLGIYQNLRDLTVIHGHGGNTKVMWLDEPEEPEEEPYQTPTTGNGGLNIPVEFQKCEQVAQGVVGPDGFCQTHGQPWPCVS